MDNASETVRGLAYLAGALLLAGCAKPPQCEGAEHARHGDPTGRDFHDAAHWAAIFDAPDRDVWQLPEQVVALMGIAPGMTVVDLGAGTGYFLPHLSRAVGPSGQVLGLDIEKSLVDYMTARAAREQLANVRALEVAPEDPGLAAGSVDRVLIVNTYHHLPDRPAYVAKLAAALKPGGEIQIVDFTQETSKGPPVKHRLRPEVVVDELNAAGLRARIAEERLPDQYVVIGQR